MAEAVDSIEAVGDRLPGSARAFLAAYRVTGGVRLSAAAAGISRQLHYKRMAGMPGYAEAFAEAQEDAADHLEEEARRRAVEGCPRYVVQKGHIVKDDSGEPIIEREYSDVLLLALLRANRPAKYVHPKAQSITQIVDARGNGGPITIEAADIGRIEVSPSRQADYDHFLELLHRAAERRGGAKRVANQLANEIIDQARPTFADADADASAAAAELASPQPQPPPPTDRPTDVPTDPPNDPPCDQDQPL